MGNEITTTGPEDTDENFESHAKEGIGNLHMESQLNRLRVPDEESVQPAGGSTAFSSMNASNENLSHHSTTDNDLIFLSRENPLGIGTSKCPEEAPPHFWKDGGAEMDYDSSTFYVSGTKSDSSDFGVKYPFLPYEESQVPNSTSFKSSENSKKEGICNDSNISEETMAMEVASFLYSRYLNNIKDDTKNCSSSLKKKDSDVQRISNDSIEEQKEILSDNVCDSGESEIPNSDVSVEKAESAAFSSGVNTDGQWRKEGGRFICTKCEKDFDWKSHVIAHYRTHTGEKPFACENCPKRFAAKCTLKMHLRTHTGGKPFVCDECHKKFREKGHLNSHRQTHRKVQPHKCHFCVKTFPSRRSLQKHIKDEHKQK